MRVSRLSELQGYIDQLQAWIAYFLNQNRCMVASDVGQNQLIGKVGHLGTLSSRGALSEKVLTEADQWNGRVPHHNIFCLIFCTSTY